VCPYDSLNITDNLPTIGGFDDITSANITGKPAVYFFGTTWCPHCGWERPIFGNVTGMFGNSIDVKKLEIDIVQPATEMEIFSHYSPEGKIPVIIIGGKYFRVGSGESIGEEAETQVLTALICKVAGSPIDACKTPAIESLMKTI
jgi:thiol-disulfide isomerase/thioredoxin